MLKHFLTKITICCTILIVPVILISCKPEKKDLCPIKMATIAGTYKMTAMKYKANATAPEKDLLIYLEDCEKDDLIILNPDGTSSYKDAGISCSPDGNKTGTWSLSGNTIISDDPDSGPEIIESFDCSTLVSYMSDVYIPGDRVTTTLKKQ